MWPMVVAEGATGTPAATARHRRHQLESPNPVRDARSSQGAETTTWERSPQEKRWTNAITPVITTRGALLSSLSLPLESASSQALWTWRLRWLMVWRMVVMESATVRLAATAGLYQHLQDGLKLVRAARSRVDVKWILLKMRQPLGQSPKSKRWRMASKSARRTLNASLSSSSLRQESASSNRL